MSVTRRIAVVLTVTHDAALGRAEEVVGVLRHLLAITPCAALSDDLGVTVESVSLGTAGKPRVDWSSEWSQEARRRAVDRGTPMWVVDLLDRAMAAG